MTDPTTVDADGLRAGAALLTAGHVAAARVAWARAGPPDDHRVRGLVRSGAALAAAERRAWRAAGRRAERARVLLPADDDRADLRAYLARLAADPVTRERTPPAVPRVEGERIRAGTLPPAALARAARALAAADDRYDAGVVADAVRYAGGEGGGLRSLLADLVGDREAGIAYRQVRRRVERRRAEERDVDALFD